MDLHKYKIDIKSDLVFVILGPFLQIININNYNFQITPIALIFNKPIIITIYPGPFILRTQSLITHTLL